MDAIKEAMIRDDDGLSAKAQAPVTDNVAKEASDYDLVLNFYNAILKPEARLLVEGPTSSYSFGDSKYAIAAALRPVVQASPVLTPTGHAAQLVGLWHEEFFGLRIKDSVLGELTRRIATLLVAYSGETLRDLQDYNAKYQALRRERMADQNYKLLMEARSELSTVRDDALEVAEEIEDDPMQTKADMVQAIRSLKRGQHLTGTQTAVPCDTSAAAQWMPIESAPKDEGVYFLGAIAGTKIATITCWDDDDGFYALNGVFKNWKPTHWMPLPSPASIEATTPVESKR